MCALSSLSGNEAAIQSHIGKALIKTQIDELLTGRWGRVGETRIMNAKK